MMQYIFLIYGATTVLCGTMVFFGLPDSPTKAWFLTAEEKQLAVVRLADNQTGIETRKVNSTQSIITRREVIANSTSGLQTQPSSGDIPRPSMLLHMDLCIRLCHRQRRRHKLQPSHHLWLRFQQDQDRTHGHSSSSCRHGRRCDSHSSILQSAKRALHLVDLLCDRWHDRSHHGPCSGCGDTPQCIAGGCLSHGFLQRALGLHAQSIFVQRSGCNEEELHGRVDCDHLW